LKAFAACLILYLRARVRAQLIWSINTIVLRFARLSAKE
jgi:hypothetical protein